MLCTYYSSHSLNNCQHHSIMDAIGHFCNATATPFKEQSVVRKKPSVVQVFSPLRIKTAASYSYFSTK